ncbi:MAG: hypothetical protein IIZ59_02530, partial [Clostridia bacterium]|nr:hypothetical protein [Clostridia bacterium]
GLLTRKTAWLSHFLKPTFVLKSGQKVGTNRAKVGMGIFFAYLCPLLGGLRKKSGQPFWANPLIFL